MDGFSTAFSCWHILKLKILELFQNFHAQAIFKNSINAYFLALIPKKKVDTMDVRYFRPISLVGEVYKTISTVLANRLESVLHGIISKPHNTFCCK